MVRLAIESDAEQLEILNNEFNGQGETSLENIKAALLNNHQEFVVVAEIDCRLVGFVCVQLKKSFCYDDYMVEITEVYVKQAYRKKGIASAMISFAEKHCKENYPFHKIELLTGKTNYTAQALYEKLGYENDGEIHLSKRIEH
jgi:ribosomal protein S18 acetylase RimI-like enzyme